MNWLTDDRWTDWQMTDERIDRWQMNHWHAPRQMNCCIPLTGIKTNGLIDRWQMNWLTDDRWTIDRHQDRWTDWQMTDEPLTGIKTDELIDRRQMNHWQASRPMNYCIPLTDRKTDELLHSVDRQEDRWTVAFHWQKAPISVRNLKKIQ